jgi:hypothetical protein
MNMHCVDIFSVCRERIVLKPNVPSMQSKCGERMIRGQNVTREERGERFRKGAIFPKAKDPGIVGFADNQKMMMGRCGMTDCNHIAGGHLR